MCGRYTLTQAQRYNICPGDEVPALGPAGATTLRWGLGDGGRLINARAETAQDKFGSLRRVLLPADGFYEWQGRRPFHFARPDREPFCFAALEARGACVILTTTPAAAVRPIHDRMPVILAPEDEDAWLEGAPIAPLARPAEVVGREVGRTVSDARADGPQCLAAPEQPSLF